MHACESCSLCVLLPAFWRCGWGTSVEYALLLLLLPVLSLKLLGSLLTTPLCAWNS